MTIERVDPAEAGMNAEKLKRIPAYFDGYIEKKRLPCTAVLVARGGQVAHLSFQGTTDGRGDCLTGFSAQPGLIGQPYGDAAHGPHLIKAGLQGQLNPQLFL